MTLLLFLRAVQSLQRLAVLFSSALCRALCRAFCRPVYH